MKYLNQKGIAPVIILIILLLLSGGIVGGSLYVKNNHQELFGKTTFTSSPQQSISQDTDSNDPVANDKVYKYNDSIIKYDFGLISNVLSCHIKQQDHYPATETEVYKNCMFAGGKFPNNPNTSKPYYYAVTNGGKGYVLEAKLSIGIYKVTESTYPFTSYKESNIYTSQKFKFTYTHPHTHPQNYQVDDKSYPNSVLFKSPDFSPEESAFAALYVSIIPDGFTNSDNSVYNYLPQSFTDEFFSLKQGEERRVNVGNKEYRFTKDFDDRVDGVAAVRIADVRPAGFNGSDVRILVKRNGLTYIIGTYMHDDFDQKGKELNIFSNYLTTFRFMQ